MANQRKRTSRKPLLLFVSGLIGLCILAVVASAFSNLGMPSSSTIVDRLSQDDKARLEEIYHLREALGESVYPGWGESNIATILYNERYAFLVNYDGTPAEGWVKVPGGERRGGAWEPVPGDDFQGRPYYRAPILDPEKTPEAFTVLVGDQWVASFPTRQWGQIKLLDDLREQLPGPLASILPLRLVNRVMLNSSDWYIAALLHESFHSFQGATARERLAAAEQANRLESSYPWDEEPLKQAWKRELSLLRQGVEAGDQEETRRLAFEFLQQRENRRRSLGLSPELVDFERQREWLEGQAKYVEMEIWRRAATTPGYRPVAAIQMVDDFESYAGFSGRWEQEVAQIEREASGEGEGRFYYSGLAQAVLLDRLMPEWKTQAMQEGVWLEDLLAEASIR